ncbi:hypothetical protein [Paraburkholderia ferrariae]|jgi:hypothetical protein|uniref:hypothetical protein n=1 Tax=Paraburkholderia ferrariae TaxID=386056 RepID=UPI000481E7F2|nr:hypothetical protein [Paraburkholderia ferrariae]
MKSLKIAVVACSLFAAAAAHAQNEAPVASTSQQVAQAAPQAAPVVQAPVQRRAATPAKKDECVGPASFCNLYSGS